MSEVPYAPTPDMKNNQGYHDKGTTSAAVPPTGFAPHSSILQDDHMSKDFMFSDETIRKGFIRKVYSILSVQLLATFGAVTLFTYHQGTRKFATNPDNIWVLIVAIVVMLAGVIAISCCEGVRRTSPHNFIILSLFTLAECYLVGASTIRFDDVIVMQAVGLTAVVVVALTIFAMQTKWDFTMMGGILFVGIILLIVFGLIASIMRSHVMSLIYSALGVFLFAIYLIYDTQLIIGNKKNSITPEEYILGAIMLYLDIINLFLHILNILGALRD